jgi:serine/threonine protein kinase
MYFFLGKPNFVQLVGFCNAPYQILTDFYSLGNLKQCLIGNRLIVPSKQLIHSFALQISGALALMHSSGFAHADIKAMNVFVDRDARGKFKCYLGDFGLAQILDDSHLVVKVHKIFNAKGLTVAYAAPELMLRLRSRDPGYVIAGWKPEGFKRSDVYSLSILFYELLNCLAAWDLAYST